jgi:nitroimidazol reductase NimA-like FMN-containing flavoprotein (pyridoxamine 5'-phosphate oxidase superfamily)
MLDQGRVEAAGAELRELPGQRPHLPEEYGVPQGDEDMLPWAWAEERLEKARNYWVCTAGADGRPHSVPVWGAWMDGTLYFDGHPMTRWGRNLKHNPAISVHLESGDEVVILEGDVLDIPKLDKERAERLAVLMKSKYASEPYEYEPNPNDWMERGLYALRPKAALAWGAFPRTLTKWKFDGGKVSDVGS